MADAAFTNTSIGFVASEELSSFFGHLSLAGSSADSLFPRRRPLHVGTGAKSAHKKPLLDRFYYQTAKQTPKRNYHFFVILFILELITKLNQLNSGTKKIT